VVFVIIGMPDVSLLRNHLALLSPRSFLIKVDLIESCIIILILWCINLPV